jgi:Spy/CpxP family protein refolding chaperone
MSSKKIGVVLAIVSFSVMAIAAGDGDSSAMREMPRGEELAKELGLSSQQKAQLKSMREEMRGVRKEHIKKMKALRDKSKEELLKPVPSRDVLYSYARESGELRRIMAEKEADHMLKVKAVLTAEQFKRLLSKDFMHPMGSAGGHHKRGPHGKGPHEETD